jgi:hypothetical protein
VPPSNQLNLLARCSPCPPVGKASGHPRWRRGAPRPAGRGTSVSVRAATRRPPAGCSATAPAGTGLGDGSGRDGDALAPRPSHPLAARRRLRLGRRRSPPPARSPLAAPHG